MVLKYFKEFYYGVAAICVLFAASVLGLAVFFAPFGLMIYLGDVLGLHDVIAFGSLIICYSVYYVIARHYDLIDFKEC